MNPGDSIKSLIGNRYSSKIDQVDIRLLTSRSSNSKVQNTSFSPSCTEYLPSGDGTHDEGIGVQIFSY